MLTTTTDRLAGLRRGAAEHGRSTAARRRVVYGDFTRDSGAAAAAELLDARPG